MPKKKGNLKAALNGHFAQQEQKARERAAQEAARRKALSVTRSGDSRSKNAKRKHASIEYDSGITDALGQASSSAERSADAPGKKRKRLPQPFARDDTILIVGEANFSFALSLLLPPRSHPPSQILATAYDSEEECYSKYPDARDIVAQIRRLAGRDDIVLFGVDAGQLDKCKHVTGAAKARAKVDSNLIHGADGGSYSTSASAGKAQRRWSKVWFGFPHVGAGHKDETRNVLANQLLLLRFLVSVAPYLTSGSLPTYAPGSSTGPKRRSGSDDEDEPEDEDVDDDAVDLDGTNLSTATTDADQAVVDETRARISALQPLQPPSRQGSVLITLRNAAPYTLWDVANLAKRLPQMLPVIAATAPALPKGVKKPSLKDLTASGLSVHSPNNLHSKAADAKNTSHARERKYRSYHLWRSFEFDPTEWRGYQHRRTIGWIQGVSTGGNDDLLRSRSAHRAEDGNVRASKAGAGECRTWEFGLS